MLTPSATSSTKTPEYNNASVVPSWIPKWTTSPWSVGESLGLTKGSYVFSTSIFIRSQMECMECQILTFRTAMWKSPWPVTPDPTERFGKTLVTGWRSSELTEWKIASVRLVQSTWIAKLCQLPIVNGDVKRMFKSWSKTLNECAFGTGRSSVGFVKGEPVSAVDSVSGCTIGFKHGFT